MNTPEPVPAHPPAPDPVAPVDGDWQPLPRRTRTLFMLGNGLGFGLLALGTLIPIGLLLRDAQGLALGLALASLVLLPGYGIWLAHRQYRTARWLLDDTGFGWRRGRLWHAETRVPRTRVQHVDLKRGPLERRFGLSTLVVHTAGTRDSAVAVQGLDAADAERLRDRLAQQVDDDDEHLVDGSDVDA